MNEPRYLTKLDVRQVSGPTVTSGTATLNVDLDPERKKFVDFISSTVEQKIDGLKEDLKQKQLVENCEQKIVNLTERIEKLEKKLSLLDNIYSIMNFIWKRKWLFFLILFIALFLVEQLSTRLNWIIDLLKKYLSAKFAIKP